MKLSTFIPLAISSANVAYAANGFATVDLTSNKGAAKSSASGWIYGFPDNGVQASTAIPAHFTKDVKFVATRAGGAQIAARGWVNGIKDYYGRFNSSLSNYRTARANGGDFILLVHDVWGADGGSISKFPGDNGDWSSADQFFAQLAGDISKNNMLDGLVLDLWNEPDIDIFWKRSWDQYLAYYVRAHKFFKSKLPSTLISGPSMAHAPRTTDSKWTAWISAVAGNSTVPDIYSWHQIGSWEREPDTTVPDFNTIKAARSLPDKPFDINEYAAKEEQNPANSVFYIGQLERHNMRGLRANWGSGSGLHDFLANLVFKNGNTYAPNGEWQVYNYYANMTGTKVGTAASSDRKFDVFATKSGSSAKVIAGTRTVQAPYEVRVSGLSALGLKSDGEVKVAVVRFDWKGPNGEVGAPVRVGTTSVNYTGDKMTITVDPPNNSTAYGYEINV